MIAKKIIYLDEAASSKADTGVVKAMEKYYLEEYGNPSSYHDMGERALKAINDVRKKIAFELGCKANLIIFTSGSTESNNLAFFGLVEGELRKKRKKIIVSAVEHSSIFAICDELKRKEFEITEIGVDKEGRIKMDELEKEINEDVLLVSVMHVNNEIGVIQDIAKIGKLCRRAGVLYHCDAAQSFGKLKIDVNSFGIDLLTGSAHKIGGPKGIGFLFVREGVDLHPIIWGGGQEKGLRGGTENVPAIAGFGVALDLIRRANKEKIREIRDYFISELEKLGGRINGSKERRIYNNVNVCFPEVNGEDFVIALSLKGIMCSTGSACENLKERDNRVLKAIGLNKKEINGSLRFSLSKDVTKKDIDSVLRELTGLLKNI